MIRTAAATLGASHVARAGAMAEAEAVLAHRSHRVRSGLEHWQTAADRGFAAAGTREEAIRTLEMLQELYAQEQRLWSYLDALEAQHATRSQLAQERGELEARVARHQRQLQELDASLEHLRPPVAEDPIRFTQP